VIALFPFDDSHVPSRSGGGEASRTLTRTVARVPAKASALTARSSRLWRTDSRRLCGSDPAAEGAQKDSRADSCQRAAPERALTWPTDSGASSSTNPGGQREAFACNRCSTVSASWSLCPRRPDRLRKVRIIEASRSRVPLQVRPGCPGSPVDLSGSRTIAHAVLRRVDPARSRRAALARSLISVDVRVPTMTRT